MDTINVATHAVVIWNDGKVEYVPTQGFSASARYASYKSIERAHSDCDCASVTPLYNEVGAGRYMSAA